MTNPQILLVDDVDFFLEVERDFLKQTPAEVTTARNGREALAAIRQRRPDLVFMDVNMPVMDGLACCRAIKQDPALATIPVIMVFAPSGDVDDGACRAAGCDGVLHKPLLRRAFLDLGRRFLFAIDRREPRVACQMTVDFQVGDETLQGMGVDLSEHGLYLSCRHPVTVDARIKVGFFLPGVSSQRLEISGRIAWVNQGFPRPALDQPQGFGVEFRVVSAEVKQILQAYVARYGSASAATESVLR